MSKALEQICGSMARTILKNFLYHDYGEYSGYNENPSLAQLYELQGLVQAAITIKLMETDK